MHVPNDLMPVILFPIVFVGIIWFLAKQSGWSRMAEKYSCDDSFAGPWSRWQSAKIGSVAYHHCLGFAFSPIGFYLKVHPAILFAFSHPSLRIPWSSIKSVEERRCMWSSVLEIRLTEPDIKILVVKNALTEAAPFLGDKLKLLK